MKGENLAKPGVPESFRVLIKELQGLALDVEIMYADGSFGELVLNDDEDERSPRHVSFKPVPAKASGASDLFHEGSVEYSGLELHETDEERDAAILSDDLFESEPQTGEQGDED